MEPQAERLFYYSKSRDVKPGKGANEFSSDPNQYKTLLGVKDWRKILSNFYVSPFKWNGRRWNSVEHAFQSAKINLVDPRKAETFTLDSGSELGRADGLAARMQRKMVFLGPKELKKWDSIKSDVMEDILYAKYTQVPLAARVLLATGDAELWHSPGRAKAERQYELERVRDRLLEDTPLNVISSIMNPDKPLKKRKMSSPRKSRSKSSSRSKSPSRSPSRSKPISISDDDTEPEDPEVISKWKDELEKRRKRAKSPSRSKSASPSKSPSPKRSPPKPMIAQSFEEIYKMK